MTFDKIIFRRKWSKRSFGELFSFAGLFLFFQVENESKIWFSYSSWHYTIDFSREICLSQTYVISYRLFVTFFPFSYSLLFIVLHKTESFLPIVFLYLSYCQQGFITVDIVINTDICVFHKQDQIKYHSYVVASGELCDTWLHWETSVEMVNQRMWQLLFSNFSFCNSSMWSCLPTFAFLI